MSEIVGVNHTGVSVSDMDRTIRFFRDVLGATVTEPHLHDDDKIRRANGVAGSRMYICQAVLAGHVFELLQYVSPDGRRTSDLSPCDAGHIHIALTVTGIDAVVERMRHAGFKPVGPVQRGLGNMDLSAIYTCGFDGLVIELIDYGDVKAAS